MLLDIMFFPECSPQNQFELHAVEGASVDAALRVRFGNYGKALDHLAALAVMLNSIGEAWHRPHSGHPSLEMESYAVGLLICAVEDLLEEEFPSPRSYKLGNRNLIVVASMDRLITSRSRAPASLQANVPQLLGTAGAVPDQGEHLSAHGATSPGRRATRRRPQSAVESQSS